MEGKERLSCPLTSLDGKRACELGCSACWVNGVPRLMVMLGLLTKAAKVRGCKHSIPCGTGGMGIPCIYLMSG